MTAALLFDIIITLFVEVEAVKSYYTNEWNYYTNGGDFSLIQMPTFTPVAFGTSTTKQDRRAPEVGVMCENLQILILNPFKFRFGCYDFRVSMASKAQRLVAVGFGFAMALHRWSGHFA